MFIKIFFSIFIFVIFLSSCAVKNLPKTRERPESELIFPTRIHLIEYQGSPTSIQNEPTNIQINPKISELQTKLDAISEKLKVLENQPDPLPRMLRGFELISMYWLFIINIFWLVVGGTLGVLINRAFTRGKSHFTFKSPLKLLRPAHQ